MNRMLICAVTAVTAVSLVAAPARTAAASERTRLQSGLDEVVAAGAVGVLAEVRDGPRVWRGTSGVAAAGTSRPVPADGRFRAGSITKSFVATVVLQLVAAGRLRLDDPAGLPGLDRRVTVRELLGQTSGVPDVVPTLPKPPSPEFFANRWRTWTTAELVDRALANPAVFQPPGSSWSYSSTNYLLLAQLVERSTGHPYAEEIERRIIRPLHLTGTSLPGTSARIPGPHPHGYVPGADGDLVDYTRLNPSFLGAAGELISTTTDLNRIFAALLDGRLLPPRLLRAMTTPAIPGAHYGLGLFLRRTSCGIPLYGHDGDALTHQSWSYSTLDRRHQVTLALTPDFHGDLDATVDAFISRSVCG